MNADDDRGAQGRLIDAFHDRTQRCVTINRSHLLCARIEQRHREGRHDDCLPVEDQRAGIKPLTEDFPEPKGFADYAASQGRLDVIAVDQAQDGKALRALLRPADRRSVTTTARKVRNGLWEALDACDDLLEDSGPDSLTMSERDALKSIRNDVLSAFHRLNDTAPDLSGLTPKERTES